MTPLNFLTVMVLSFALSTFVVTAPIVHEPELADYEVFLANATDYSFSIGCGPGEVLSAQLEPNDQMIIHYFYRCDGYKQFGTVAGQLNRKTGTLRGSLLRENQDQPKAVSLTFSPSGEAVGAWEGEQGGIDIRLKE